MDAPTTTNIQGSHPIFKSIQLIMTTKSSTSLPLSLSPSLISKMHYLASQEIYYCQSLHVKTYADSQSIIQSTYQ